MPMYPQHSTWFFDDYGVPLEVFRERVRELERSMSPDEAFRTAFIEQAERVLAELDTPMGAFKELEQAWKKFERELLGAFMEFIGIAIIIMSAIPIIAMRIEHADTPTTQVFMDYWYLAVLPFVALPIASKIMRRY